MVVGGGIVAGMFGAIALVEDQGGLSVRVLGFALLMVCAGGEEGENIGNFTR